MKIFYLCDKKKICNENCGKCIHTKDITHAKNFKRDGEDFIEVEPNFNIGNFTPEALYHFLINNVKYETLIEVVGAINNDMKKCLKC